MQVGGLVNSNFNQEIFIAKLDLSGACIWMTVKPQPRQKECRTTTDIVVIFRLSKELK